MDIFMDISTLILQIWDFFSTTQIMHVNFFFNLISE